MAYCTVDDIKEYSNITSLSTTTRPTLLAVEDMIDTHGGVINAQRFIPTLAGNIILS